jgi:hypothetical protein
MIGGTCGLEFKTFLGILFAIKNGIKICSKKLLRGRCV